MRPPKYSRYAPEGSFIDLFMRYMDDLETPLPYDFWSALWVLSVVVGRRVYIARPSLPVYLNVYCIIVAESGVTRKSTAVKRASDVAQRFLEEVGRQHIWLSTKTTPETIEYHMHQHSLEHGSAQLVISVSELVRFLGKEKYNNALPGMLTDLYDSPDLLRSPGTLSRGATSIKNVYVSLLAACAPSWLVRSIHPDVVEGGFTSRVLFVVANRRKRKVAWPAIARRDSQTLHDRLREIDAQAKSVSAIHLTPAAIRALESWYRTKAEHADPFRSSFEAREDDHVLRVAGLLAINADRWQVEVADIRAAIKCVSAVKNDGAQIFDAGGYSDKTVSCIERLRDVLVEAGTQALTQTQVYNIAKAYVDAKRLKIILAIMHEMQLVQKFELRKSRTGAPTKLWRATDKLAKMGASQLVAEEVRRRV